jgi:SAM-dependent methyltransferase
VAGRVTLDEYEADALRRSVGCVAGLDVCHVQCHIGFDSILLARAGARVTGIDFSQVALDKARRLARACGVEVDFVESDACNPPRSLEGVFDLVYATVGVLCWIEDVDAWMRAAARLARPGGHLVIVELHPLLTMFDTIDPPATGFPYNFDGPHRFDADGSYTDRNAHLAATTTVEYAHGVGEVVTAALGAGWELTFLAEHTAAPRDYFGNLGDPEPDGYHRVRLGEEPVPMLYTLLARRSPGGTS